MSAGPAVGVVVSRVGFDDFSLPILNVLSLQFTQQTDGNSTEGYGSKGG